MLLTNRQESQRIFRPFAVFLKYCAACRNGNKKRPDLSYFCFPVNPDERKKWEVFCKRADKKFKRLVDPRICSLHFMETDIEISISDRNNVRSGCYPTMFDPTKAKETTSARAKRLDNRKRRCVEQPKAKKFCPTPLNFKDATDNFVHTVANMTTVNHDHSYSCSQEQATPENNMFSNIGLPEGKCNR